jgi:hypothetical protein
MQCACVVLSSVACRLYRIFPNHLVEKHDFLKKKVTEHKTRVLVFSNNVVCDISQSKNNAARYDQKCKLVLM